jgi:hypothetical protein
MMLQALAIERAAATRTAERVLHHHIAQYRVLFVDQLNPVRSTHIQWRNQISFRWTRDINRHSCGSARETDAFSVAAWIGGGFLGPDHPDAGADEHGQAF